MYNKHISSTTEVRSEGILNNGTEPNISHVTMNFQCNEQYFDDIMNSIKVEKVSSFLDELTDSEDSASIAYKYMDSKNKEQQHDEIYKLVSYVKDVNVTESNSQELTNTISVDSKIVSVHTRSPSTALPIMKILSPNSGPHTCLECCFKCNMVFRVLDNPLHICRIRSINKRNEFLKIEPSLCVDSCLCDFCWRQLEKTYKFNKSKNRKEGHSEKNSKLLEHSVKKIVSKNQNHARRCLFNLCSEPNCHKLSVNECENIKKLFSTIESRHLVFVQSTNQYADYLTFPFSLCRNHNSMVMVMLKCQICGEKLNAPFNADDWSMHKMWNFVLIENNLPLILKPGMFICVTCKGHISKTNPGFPTIDLPRLQEYILINNAYRSKLYGESQYNVFNVCQGPTYVAPPIVVSMIEKEYVHSTKVLFTDHLATNNSSQIGYFKHDEESITRTEQNPLKSKLESKNKGLNFVQHEKKYLKTFTANKPKDQLYNSYTDPTPNTSGIDIMTNSLNKSVDDTFENILSEQNSFANLTNNNFTNNYSNFSYAATNHVVGYDNSNDLIQLHVDHQLKNYDCELSKNEKINQYLGNANDNSLQNVCIVNNVEINENESEIIGSQQVISGHNEIENIQKELNSHAICNVAQDRSSMNLKEAVQPPNAIINHVSIKRKQCNGLCDTISNKDVKKQRLNEKYSSYENNSTDDNTTISYRNKNITHSSINLPSISNMTYNCKNRYVPSSDKSDSNSFSDSEIFSETDSEEISPDIQVNETEYIIVPLDNDLSLDSDCKLVKCKLEIKPDHEIEMDCKFVSDSEKSLDGESILENYTTQLDSVKDSNCEMVPDAETESDGDEQSYINISVTDEEFNNNKLSPFKIVSNVQKGPDHEILLDGDKVFETASWSKKGTIKYTIISDDEIKPSCNKGSICIIISDNDEEFKNKVFYTYKINVQKGSDSKILLDGEKVKIMSESENIKSTYEIEPSGNKKSKCIIIFDNEKEFINKKLSTFKIVSNVKKGSKFEILLGYAKVYDIDCKSENRKIKYMIVSKDEMKSSGNKGFQCTFVPDNEEKCNNKKSTFKILVKNVLKG